MSEFLDAWLAEDRVRPQILRGLDEIGVRADDHDRGVAAAHALAPSLEELRAVHIGKREIDDEHVGARGNGQAERVKPVDRRDDFEARVPELLFQQHPNVVLVVDDKYAPTARRHPAGAAAAPADNGPPPPGGPPPPPTCGVPPPPAPPGGGGGGGAPGARARGARRSRSRGSDGGAACRCACRAPC